MKKIIIVFLSVLSLTMLNSQTPDKWTLYVFVGTYTPESVRSVVRDTKIL
jgi:hypothetical protein